LVGAMVRTVVGGEDDARIPRRVRQKRSGFTIDTSAGIEETVGQGWFRGLTK
jgi:hypothetical protein